MGEARAAIGFLVKKHRNGLDILLARKREGDNGCGRFRPYGGKCKPGETNERTMLRELNEEANVTALPEDLEEVGTIIRRNYYRSRRMGRYRYLGTWIVKIYLIHAWDGIPSDSDEMIDPHWFRVRSRHDHELPLKRMLAGDCEAIFQIVAGQKVTISAAYDLETLELVDDPDIPGLSVSCMKRLAPMR